MKIVYVDDEFPALENFKYTVKDIKEVEDLHLFSSGKEALSWIQEHAQEVDLVFLDMEMPAMHGLDLGKEIKKINEDILFVYVTAYEQFALQAFKVDALGYVLKPYTQEEIRKEILKASRFKKKPTHRVQILTIPDFVLKVDDRVVSFQRYKVEELLALLVDKEDAGVTVGDAIASLWPDRASDEATQALYRNTAKRLLDMLKELKIDDILCVEGRKRYLRKEKVDCDLYHILDGDYTYLQNYNGEYMRRYEWAEDRNGWLYQLKLQQEKKSRG